MKCISRQRENKAHFFYFVFFFNSEVVNITFPRVVKEGFIIIVSEETEVRLKLNTAKVKMSVYSQNLLLGFRKVQ